jgi:hypothetical protein
MSESRPTPREDGSVPFQAAGTGLAMGGLRWKRATATPIGTCLPFLGFGPEEPLKPRKR